MHPTTRPLLLRLTTPLLALLGACEAPFAKPTATPPPVATATASPTA